MAVPAPPIEGHHQLALYNILLEEVKVMELNKILKVIGTVFGVALIVWLIAFLVGRRD